MFPSRVIARLILAAGLVLAPGARASESPEPAADRTLSPYFFVEGGDSGVDRLPLLGSARKDRAGSLFLFVLGTSLEVGLSLPEAFEQAARTAASPELRSLGERLKADAISGRFRLEDVLVSLIHHVTCL